MECACSYVCAWMILVVAVVALQMNNNNLTLVGVKLTITITIKIKELVRLLFVISTILQESESIVADWFEDCLGCCQSHGCSASCDLF